MRIIFNVNICKSDIYTILIEDTIHIFRIYIAKINMCDFDLVQQGIKPDFPT